MEQWAGRFDDGGQRDGGGGAGPGKGKVYVK